MHCWVLLSHLWYTIALESPLHRWVVARTDGLFLLLLYIVLTSIQTHVFHGDWIWILCSKHWLICCFARDIGYQSGKKHNQFTQCFSVLQFSKAIHFALFRSHIEHSARDYSNINQILLEYKILITLGISCMEYDPILKEKKRVTMRSLKLVFVISHLKNTITNRI